MTTLTVKNLSKSFHKRKILNDISFELNDKKIYGLLGRNGVGKSTLLNCICNRLLIKQGEVLIDNQKIHGNNDLLHRIYLMNDNTQMYYGWEKIVDLYSYTDIAYHHFDYSKAHQLAKRFGINEQQKFKDLSTGLRTAAKIILALCVNAEIIFLDEPTLGLDATLREIFYQELLKSYNERPRIFMISTHLINEIQNLLEDALIIKDGKLLLKEPVNKIQQKVVQLKGPKAMIWDLIDPSDTINQIDLGKQLIVNTNVDKLTDKSIPDKVDISPVDLQTAFNVLTE